MPYTVKTQISLDPSVPDDEQIARVKALFLQPVPPAVLAVLDEATKSGQLLARTASLATDGKSIQIIAVWRSKVAFNAACNHPAMTENRHAMWIDGWHIIREIV